MNDLDDLLRPKPKRTDRQRQAKIVTLDIERRMGLCRFWDARTEYVPHRDVISNPSMLCISWKWLGEKDVQFASVWEHGRVGMAELVWQVYNTADVVIGYNSVGFDTRHIRTEWYELGMIEPAPVKEVDLFRAIKRRFGFEHRSLDAICKRLGLHGKFGAYNADDADRAADGDARAQAKLRRYNAGDVRITEALYLRTLGWLPSHPNIGDGDELACVQCGSTDLKANGWYRAVVLDYPLYRCRNCAGQVRGSHSKRIANTVSVR